MKPRKTCKRTLLPMQIQKMCLSNSILTMSSKLMFTLLPDNILKAIYHWYSPTAMLCRVLSFKMQIQHSVSVKSCIVCDCRQLQWSRSIHGHVLLD